MENEKKDKYFAPAVIAILAIVIVILLLKGCSTDNETTVTKGSMEIDTRTKSTKMEEETTKEDRGVYFAGISDGIINSETRVILENLPENEEYLMKYEIYMEDSEDLLFETELIPSGEHVVWMAGEDLKEPGNYKLLFVESPFAPDGNGGYEPLTVGRNVVNFKVE